jgi:hypothetical protein
MFRVKILNIFLFYCNFICLNSLLLYYKLLHMSKTKISDNLKAQVRALQNNPITNNAICYLTGDDLLESDIEYDHVIPEAQGGLTDISNIRIISSTLNRRKGKKSVLDFKYLLEIEALFKDKKSIKLQNLLDYKKIQNKPITFNITDNYASFGNCNYPLFYCDKTNTKYFFAKIEFCYITNDTNSGLQPRDIEIKKLMDLQENLQNRPQLQPSIARYVNGNLLLFDGQHKAGARILNDEKDLELKIYIDISNDEKLFEILMLTNLEAHNKFKQTGFACSVLVNKMSNVSTYHFDEYLKSTQDKHSEVGYLNFLIDVKKFKKREAENVIRNGILEAYLDVFGLKFVFIDRVFGGTHEKGISLPTFKKCFIRSLCCDDLLDSDFSIEARKQEVINFQKITAMFSKYAKIKNETFKKRFFSIYSLYTVCSIVRDLIISVCNIYTENGRRRLLVDVVLDTHTESILQQCIDKIYGHALWFDESTELVWKSNSTKAINDLFIKNNLAVSDIVKQLEIK